MQSILNDMDVETFNRQQYYNLRTYKEWDSEIKYDEKNGTTTIDLIPTWNSVESRSRSSASKTRRSRSSKK
jgi:hypothetical protein